MSRIGKKPIILPAGTEAKVDGTTVTVKGKLGELSRTVKPVVTVTVEGNTVTLAPKNEELETLALWGTYASHVNNMVKGVNEEYVKKLLIEGVGYKAAVQGDKLVLNIGFSHPVNMSIPKGIKCEVEKNQITISGIDKEVVGEFAATIRAQKKPEPYKGKGIRYEDEIIRRKEGKKAV